MQTLYQIDGRIAAALENLADEDGVINEEAAAELEQLEEVDRPLKIEACALFVKDRRAMAAAIRAEEVALAARRRRYEADAERVEKILAASLNGERFETPRALITWRRSRAVELEDGAETRWDDDQISRFLVFSHRINKQAVADAINHGEDVPGAAIVERQNMSIEGVAKRGNV